MVYLSQNLNVLEKRSKLKSKKIVGLDTRDKLIKRGNKKNLKKTRGDTPSPSVTSAQTCLPISAVSLEADFDRGLLPTRRPTSAPSLREEEYSHGAC